MKRPRVLVVALVGLVALAVWAGSVPPARAQGVQITIAQPAEATTMDPGRSTQVLTVNYFYNLYDSLTRWDNALALQPGLATAWRSVNETTWEFTLRTGVKFHDGAPLTAEDVKATLERNLVPGKTGVTAGFATIEAVQVPAPGLVRIVTKKPDPLLPVRMAQMGSQILPARLTTDEGVKELARKPVGTGAYRFVEWVKDERLVMEANRDWWGWEGRKPGVDRIVWKPIPEDFPRLVALEKGEADIVTNVPPDRIKAIAEGRTHAHRERALVADGRLRDQRDPGAPRRQAGPAGPPPRHRHQHRHQGHLRRLRQAVFGRGGRHRLRLQPCPQAVSPRRGARQGAADRGGLPERYRHRAACRDGDDGQRQAAHRGAHRHAGEGGHPRAHRHAGNGRAAEDGERSRDPRGGAPPHQPPVHLCSTRTAASGGCSIRPGSMESTGRAASPGIAFTT